MTGEKLWQWRCEVSDGFATLLLELCQNQAIEEDSPINKYLYRTSLI